MASFTPSARSGLTIVPVISRLKTILSGNPSAVLVAPPGAGKTTAVPLALLDEPWLADRRILLLAPRRLAARAAAARMAWLLGEPVGQTVGYRVRMERCEGAATRILVITEGVLTRMLQTDPALDGVSLVIFDEFHERSLDADLGLALCRDIQGVFNTPLRLLVMSATLDPAPVTELLNGAPLIRCDGRAHPVETRYRPPPAADRLEGWIVETVRRAIAASEGSILVFLPGAPEIRRISRRLTDSGLPAGWCVAPLFGNLPGTLQDAAIAPAPAGRYKIVLASAIAETSLTIEGIRVVVDSGLQRLARFDPVGGMTRLVTLPVSRASADQRRGRAGRSGPGVCYRLWSEALHATLPPHNRPEILDTDLTGLALELALWGVADPNALGWLDPPPAPAVAEARRLLAALGALDRDGGITPHGRRMAAMPLHPRLAHMILMAQEEGAGLPACTVAAILSERDPLYFDRHARQADMALRLDIVEDHQRGQIAPLSGCTIDRAALRRIAKVAAMLRKRLCVTGKETAGEPLGRLLAWAYPDRIARMRRDQPGRFLLSNGRGAFLDTAEPLCASEFIVAARLDGERRDARIFLAAATDRQCLEEQFADRIDQDACLHWNAERRQVTAVRRKRLGALTLGEQPMPHPDPDAVLTVMLGGIREGGLEMLPWTRRMRTWQSRVSLLARTGAPGGPWPDVSDAMLADTLDQWLGPHLIGRSHLQALSRRQFADALNGLLTWRQHRLLETLAPTHITVPSGSRLPIDYQGPTPVLAVRIQEMFGEAATPAIVDGRVPLLLHLLSPAGRPAQITRDLAGFWQNGYPAVKGELRGRYPKHPWPDDPLNAVPTARAKPGRGRRRN